MSGGSVASKLNSLGEATLVVAPLSTLFDNVLRSFALLRSTNEMNLNNEGAYG
jgi:hypothetical protein